MRNFIFLILLFVPLSLFAENYNGFWIVEKKTNCSEFFFWDLAKLKIDNNKAQYTVRNKNGWSHKYIGKVKKNKIGMNSIDATMIGKIKNDKITMKFTNIRDSWEWENLLSDCQIVFTSSNNLDLDKQITKTKAKKIKTTTGINKGSQEDLIVNVGDRVFFGYDSADLDSDALELLQDQASWLNQNRDVNVTIEGHTDERSTFNFSLAIGERRAQAVKNYLIGLGIDPQRISTVSYGKSRPAVIGSNDSAWAQNRRAVTLVN